MKRLITLVVAVAVTALACGSAPAGAAKAKTPAVAVRKPERLLVFGHSIPYGYGASSLATSWAHMAAIGTCRELTNDAVASTNSTDALAAVQNGGPYRPGDVIAVETGLNDVRYYGADPAHALVYWNNMAGILWAARTPQGVPVPVILVADPGPAAAGWSEYPPSTNGTQAILDEYDLMEQTLVQGWPAATVVDVRSQWSDADVAVDDIHPNDTGHAIIAYSVMGQMEQRGLSNCG